MIAGRLEPGVGAIEDMARAMFGDEAEPIALVPAGGTAAPATRPNSDVTAWRVISPESLRSTLPGLPSR